MLVSSTEISNSYSNKQNSNAQNDRLPVGGRLKYFFHEWKKYTSDPTILEIVSGYKLKFEEFPTQTFKPRPYKLNPEEKPEIDAEICSLYNKGVIEQTYPEQGDFVSSIFTRRKKDGGLRIILDLSKLNEYLEYHHFKMDTFDVASKMVTKDCYMASLDLKDAYYSVPIAIEDRKYLKFYWNNTLWQYKALCNGLSSGPRIFTKLMKPPYAMLRSAGIQIVGYIDDSLLVAKSKEEAMKAVKYTAELLSNLGFIVHPTKSVVTPCKEIQYLGFIINSHDLKISLPQSRKDEIKNLCKRILGRKKDTIRKVSELIGKIVAAFPGAQYGMLHYRELEKEKTAALVQNRGNFDAIMRIREDARQDAQWWLNNVQDEYKPIIREHPSICLSSDASLAGWGCTDNTTHIGGRWNRNEVSKFAISGINYLETLAAFFGLKSFCKYMHDVHVHLQIDNTTAVAYINKMGGTKSHDCNHLAKQIWNWCIQRKIWITATHLPGKCNVIADEKSRVFQDHTEWMLNKTVFRQLCDIYGTPEIDLFATRLNTQLPVYISWKPDPGAIGVDAFTQNWASKFFYAFPPFCLIAKCLQKIEQDEAEGLIIVPKWPTQSWFPKLLSLLIEEPLILRRSKQLLELPGTTEQHPLINSMFLLSCRVSGVPSQIERFQRRLRMLYCHHGEMELRDSIQHILNNGNNFVINNRLITCKQISQMF